MSKLTSIFFIYVLFVVSQAFAAVATISKNDPDLPNTQSAQEQQVQKYDNKPVYLPSFANIVDPLIPAVVNIYTVQYNKHSPKHSKKSPFPEGFLFDNFNDLFEQFSIPFNSESYLNPQAVSLGSGFIIDTSGIIVTNHHVVSNADEIHVKLIDNTELPAKLIGSDQRTDLALLKVEPKAPLPHVKLGDSSKARVGDWVIAIGNPFGLGGTVTTGIISSKGRDIDINTGGIIDDFIQTDAAINSGNSGGPMFNLDGEVIAVNTAIFSPSGTNIGIGFSIPSNTAKTIIEQLRKNGKITRGRLDITIQEITPDIAETLELSETSGVLVTSVLSGGAADKAGIESGDVIVEFAGIPVKNSRKLQVLVAEAQVDTNIPITVIRNGKTHNITVKILEADNIKRSVKVKDEDRSTNTHSIEINNITFSNLNDELRVKFGIQNNVNSVIVTHIEKSSKNQGLKVGDQIVMIDKQYVRDIGDFKRLYNSAKASKKRILLLVKRDGTNIYVTMPIN